MTVQYYPGYAQAQVQQNLIWQVISSITQANPMVLTTTNTHNYPVGVNVSFLIPPSFGMTQLNGLNIQVISVTADTMTCNIDSTSFTPFAAPSPLPTAYTPAVVYANSSGPYLPPQPLPYGNQDSFEGVIANDGQPGDLIWSS